jgi:hypothetical protein
MAFFWSSHWVPSPLARASLGLQAERNSQATYTNNRVSSGFEPMTFGLAGGRLNHYTMR